MTSVARRALLASPLALHLLGASAQGAPLPVLRILVAAEGLRRLAPILAEFAASRPDLLRELTVREQDPAWVGSELAEEARTGRSSVDVVLTGAAGLALGNMGGLWLSLPNALRASGEASMNRFSRLMRPLTEDNAMMIAAPPTGPLLLSRETVLPYPPGSAAGLLDYARQNPERFLYPRPSESPLGQQFLMVLPYLLGDRDPMDPQTGWSRSWAWLEEMDSFISYYPTTGTAALEEFAEGGIDLMPAPLTTFLRGRTSGLLPEDTVFTTFEDGPFIPLGLFLAVPRPVPAGYLPAIRALAEFLLHPDIQTRAFGRGLLQGDPEFSPAAADLLTEAERTVWSRAVPPETAQRLAAIPHASLLAPGEMAYMMRRWTERIGARHWDAR